MKQITITAIFSATLAFGGPIENLKAGEWYEVPNSHMNALDPCPAHNCAYSAVEGVSAVMNDWAGGIFDSKRDRLIVTGGGHSGYGGNELYAFDLNLLKWLRITEPYANPPQCQDPYPDGTPSSRHTYGGLDYITHADRFFMAGGDIWYMPGGCGSNKTFTCDLSGPTWALKSPAGTAPSGAKGANCAYDPVSKKVYYHDVDNGWFSYDYDNNRWTKVNNYNAGYYRTSVVDPVNRKLVEVGQGRVDLYDLTTTDLTKQAITTTGASAVVSGRPGLAYDPTLGKVVAWTSGTDFYSLDLASKVWTRHTPTNSVVPGAPNSNGTYGRFRYSPNKNVYVMANEVDKNVFIYKLTAGTGAEKESAYGGQGKRANGKGQIQISPNPVRSEAVLRIAGAHAAAELSVYDLSGKRIAHLTAPAGKPAVWNAGEVPAGVYLVQAATRGEVISRKLLIQK